ncbi:glycosyltransferase family 4 protein [Mesobacillus selenatarsenatis]|uniref:Glycosyltransferase n=1 Tax=Mesobacillus selenatarsenatis (strain DSM 18680 / JCM 14380 / FERM P-15431 / SF-1) TaxID=1321606 RepID=A0A0A8XB17_MESS1|nr:glycosyltransferase family 4 protein [Mesobacillus selenatarsenatis]GAM16232.1 glycosyltransferase [Mesobacillus selenatarsenatis SF-1]
MKKKIWLLNHYATDMYKNRGGRHYWFAENLIKQGYDVTVFCANTYHNKSEYIDTKNKKYATDTVDNIPFVFVKTTTALGNGIDRVKNMGLFYFNLFSVAKEYVKLQGKPDIILASSVHPLTMVAGIQIAKKLNVPCICEVRDLWPEAIFSFNKAKERSLLGRLLTAGEHWIYKKADALIFTKEGDTDYIIEKKWDTGQGGDINLDKCYYINNGVDIGGFEISSNENKVEDDDLHADKFNVIYVGAIRPVNNVGNILDAASILKHDEDIQFLIYGDGNQKDMLDKRVAEEKLTNVKMKGFVDKRSIPYILSRSSVNILNYSQTQYNWARGNSSNKLFEYMASSKPIISTVKMGYSILNKYKCGIELEIDNPEELADAILEIKNMSKNQYNKMGQNARNGAKDFDFKKLTMKLVDVIDSVDINKEKEVSTKYKNVI